MWGDTVNVASRLEAHGLPGRIHVSEQTRRALEHRYEFEPRGAVHLRGKGSMRTAFLSARTTCTPSRPQLSGIDPKRDDQSCIGNPRLPGRVLHTLAEMIRFRVLLISAGYPDANDSDALRTDPAFKMALGRAPESS